MFIEKILVRTLPIVMDFFSKVLFNIDIAAGIKAIIKRIRKPADEVFEVIFRWLRKKVNKFRKKGKKGKDEKKETKEESKKDMKEGKKNVKKWWNARENFKLGDERHEFYFKGQGKNAKLMMASNDPRPLLTKVEQLKLPPTTIDALKTQANQMYDYIEKHHAKQTKGNKENISIAPKIQKYLNSMAQYLVSHNQKLTNVTFKMSKGKATKIIANPLTKNAGNTKGQGLSSGSAGPSPKGWEYARFLNLSSKTKHEWERLHLLNHNLHGPLSLWNLFPGRKRLNDDMRVIEGLVKPSVNKGNEYYYEVDVTYHDPEVRSVQRNYLTKNFRV